MCSKCRCLKELGEFNKDAGGPGGYKSQCRKCVNTHKKIFRELNKVEISKYRKDYYIIHQEEEKQYVRDYCKNNRPSINAYRRNKRKTDINYRLSDNLRSRQRAAIKGMLKVGSAVRDLGCTMDEFVKYIEAKFYDHPTTGEKMTWGNHSYEGWHLDHTIPLCNFNLEDREEFLKAFHYTNLQPLWAMENFCKSKKVK